MDNTGRGKQVPGAWARSFGCGLLVPGIVWSVWLALPLESFSRAGASPLAEKIPLPHGTVVWLCLALVLLAWEVGLLGRGNFRRAFGLAGAGSVLYASGCVLQVWSPTAAWLLPAGTLVAGAGVLTATLTDVSGRNRWLCGTVVLGLGLETLLSAGTLLPSAPLAAGFGAPEELPRRLLRLARVAAVVLPLIALALGELRNRTAGSAFNMQGKRWRGVEWLTRGLAAGAVGMPLLLTIAAVVDLRGKYLLPIAADLVLAGTLTGAWLSWRLRNRREFLGWSLVAASMLVGMGIGGYAFDGPLPSPVGSYGDLVRTAMREVHSGTIVLGVVLLLGWPRRSRPADP